MNMRANTIFAVAILASIAAAGDAKSEEKPDTVRVFYFGNSLTGSAMPTLHEDLGRSAGKQWICDAFLGAGLDDGECTAVKQYVAHQGEYDE